MMHSPILLSLFSFLLLLELNAAHSQQADEPFGDRTPTAALIRQATEAGMDTAALTELLRTQQPVIISKTNAEGQTRTTTYKLTPDGTGISSRTITESKPRLVSLGTDSGRSARLELGTRSSAAEAAPAAATNPENDWEWAPGPRTNTRTYTYSGTRPFGFGGSAGSDWPSLFGNRQPAVSTATSGGTGTPSSGTTTTHSFGGLPPSWHNREWFLKPDFDLPAGVTPKTTTKTEVDDQGRTVTTTTKFYSSGGTGALPSNWPSLFGPADGEVPSLKPHLRPGLFDDWKPKTTLFDEDEGPKVPSPRPSVPTPRARTVPTPLPLPTRPSTVVPPKSATVSTALPNFGFDIKNTTPLPSLDDFLNRQYGAGTSVTRHRLEDFTTTTTPRTLATINIDDLPGAQTTSFKAPGLQPIDDDWLRSLGDGFEPSDSNTNTRTKVTSINRTYNSAAPPSTADLEPQLRDVLTRAGISDEDIRNASGDSVTRTRVEPDGRVIKTTYRVRTVPSTYNNVAHTFADSLPPSSTPSYVHKGTRSTQEVQDSGSIEKFLSKVNLSPSEILAQRGEVVKTLVDDDGRVLSATFVLSTVKENEQGESKKELPDK